MAIRLAAQVVVVVACCSGVKVVAVEVPSKVAEVPFNVDEVQCKVAVAVPSKAAEVRCAVLKVVLALCKQPIVDVVPAPATRVVPVVHV